MEILLHEALDDTVKSGALITESKIFPFQRLPSAQRAEVLSCLWHGPEAHCDQPDNIAIHIGPTYLP